MRYFDIALVTLALLLIAEYLFKKFDKTNNKICDFKLTKPKFKKGLNKESATFSILVKKYDRFFVDFPTMFRFYSTSAFRSKIRISYTNPDDETVEQVYDKEVIFDGVNTVEHLYYISDVIVGRIDIEIESTINYGKPTIGFEILPNKMCKMMKKYKLEVKFPHF